MEKKTNSETTIIHDIYGEKFIREIKKNSNIQFDYELSKIEMQENEENNNLISKMYIYDKKTKEKSNC